MDFANRGINKSKFYCMLFFQNTADHYDNDTMKENCFGRFYLRENENIDMILNVDEKTLKFKFGAEILKSYSMDIDFENKIYHMAVCFRNICSVELMRFDIKH